MVARIINKDFWMKWFLVAAVLGMAISFQKLFLLHVVFIFIAIVLASKKLRTQSGFHFDIQPTYLHLFPLLMFVWYTVMTPFSPHMDHASKYLFYIFNGLFIVLFIVYYSENIDYLNKVYRTLSVIFTIEIIVSLIETYTPFKMPLSPFSPVLSFFGRSYNPEFDIKVMEYTPTAFHWNPNDLSIAMTIIFPFFLLTKNIFPKIFGIVSIFIIVIADSSRACLITLILMMIVYLLMYQRKWLVRLVPVFVVLWLLSPLFFNHMKTTTFSQSVEDSVVSLKYSVTKLSPVLDSIGLRQRLFLDGLHSIVQSRGMGIGPGEDMYLHKASIGKDYFAMHFFWLELCVEAGVILGLLFIAWHFYMAYKLWKLSRSTKDATLGYYAEAAFLSLVGFLPAAVSASSVIYFLPMWIMYGFSIAIIHNGKRQEQIPGS